MCAYCASTRPLAPVQPYPFPPDPADPPTARTRDRKSQKNVKICPNGSKNCQVPARRRLARTVKRAYRVRFARSVAQKMRIGKGKLSSEHPNRRERAQGRQIALYAFFQPQTWENGAIRPSKPFRTASRARRAGANGEPTARTRPPGAVGPSCIQLSPAGALTDGAGGRKTRSAAKNRPECPKSGQVHFPLVPLERGVRPGSKTQNRLKIEKNLHQPFFRSHKWGGCTVLPSASEPRQLTCKPT